MLKYLLGLAILFASCDKSTGNENVPLKEENETEIQDTTKNAEFYLYIGTYTDAGSKGIYLANFDTETGKISTPILAAEVNNPSFQIISPDGNKLWSVNESWSGLGEVHSFVVSETDGSLKVAGIKSSEGKSPCHLGYLQVGETEHIFVANYSSGNVARIPKIGETTTHQHLGKGPNKSRQSEPHAHCVKVDGNQKFAYSCDLGTDKVYVYDLSKEGLQLHTEINITAGAGPRHLDFHPQMKAMSVVNELNSTVEVFLPDDEGCFTRLLTVIPTIPESFTENNQCADIHYSADGKYLYASNRGHNSIVTYKVNPENMMLELVGWMHEEISWPRNFTLTPHGDFLLVANQNSNSITVYTINLENGQLTYSNTKVSVSKPICLNLLQKN